MKHFTNLAAAQSLSTGSYCAKVGPGLKSLDTLFRALTIVFCLALSFTPTLAEADTICFLGVLKLNDSGHEEAQNYVIKTETEWQSLWEKIFSNTSEKLPLPKIDFTRRTIVAVFQGAQPSGGYEISIEGIVGTENSLEVVVKALAPGKGCVVTGKVTRPFDIIEIERTEKQVVFHVKHKVRNCE